MINVIGRLSGPGIFLLLVMVASNALAITLDDIKNTKVYGSPTINMEVGIDIKAKVMSCYSVGIDTINSITELILNVGTDPVAAQEKLKLPIDHALLICGNARYLLENGKHKSPHLLDWVKQQELGWRTTRNAAGRAAFHIARYNNAIDVWKNNWIPKLREKKKKFRETGTDISKKYNELFAMSERGEFDEAFENKLSRFRTTVNASKSLQMSLVNLREFVINDLKAGSPFGDVNIEDINVFRLMAPITKIDKTDRWWHDKAVIWFDKITSLYAEVLLTYEKLDKHVESLRKQTLFRSHGKPLQGIKFTEIHPTFQRLYDDLYKKGKNYELKVSAEEKRWEEDRKNVEKYFEECGASAERDQKLKVVRTGTTATAVRDLKLESARGPSSADNEREAAEEHDRKMYEDGMAVLKKQDEQAEKEYGKWEAECTKKRIVADKVMKDNAKRRRELGLPRKPVYGS